MTLIVSIKLLFKKLKFLIMFYLKVNIITIGETKLTSDGRRRGALSTQRRVSLHLTGSIHAHNRSLLIAEATIRLTLGPHARTPKIARSALAVVARDALRRLLGQTALVRRHVEYVTLLRDFGTYYLTRFVA